eukprot:gene37087-44378_t
MTEVQPGAQETEPAIDRSERSGSIGLLLALAGGLVAAAVALAIMPRTNAAPYVQVLLGVLAVVGVFSLFAGAIGLIRFGARSDKQGLPQTILDAHSDGVVVSDREGRVIYSNRAYAEMTRVSDRRDIRSVEWAFASNPDASEPMFRLMRAAREGRPA